MPKAKLTPDVHETIVEHVSGCNYHSVAARAAGISERTLDRWLARGRAAHEADDDPADLEAPYLALFLEVEQSSAVGEAELFGNVEKPEWKLERRFPERYGKRITIDVKKAAASHLLDILRENLSDEAFDEVISVLDGDGL